MPPSNPLYPTSARITKRGHLPLRRIVQITHLHLPGPPQPVRRKEGEQRVTFPVAFAVPVVTQNIGRRERAQKCMRKTMQALFHEGSGQLLTVLMSECAAELASCGSEEGMR